MCYFRPSFLVLKVKYGRMVLSLKRGHEIEFIYGQWVYSDNKEGVDIDRPCIKCGKMPTKEGHDSCLSCIPGIRFACCGHGKENPYLVS